MNEIEVIGVLCSEIENELIIYGDYVSNNLIDKTNILLQIIDKAPVEYKVAVEKQLLAFTTKAQGYSKVWLYSAIIRLTYNSKILEEFLDYIIKEEKFREILEADKL